jgi:DNA-directed RNA polymerase specialized sigma24 family protein
MTRILLLTKDQQESVLILKRELKEYVLNRNREKYEKDILPGFRTLIKMCFDDIKYDPLLVSDSDIEEMLLDAETHCYYAIDKFKFYNRYPESYFFQVIRNFMFHRVRERQKSGRESMSATPEEPTVPFDDPFVKDDFMIDLKKNLMERREKYRPDLNIKNNREDAFIDAMFKFFDNDLPLNKKSFSKFIQKETGMDGKKARKVAKALQKNKESWWPTDYLT